MPGYRIQTPLKMSWRNAAKTDGVHGRTGQPARGAATVASPNKYDAVIRLIVVANQSDTESAICR